MSLTFHPRLDDHGHQVKINNPSKATPLSGFNNPSNIVSVLPDGEVPESLNGIPFSSWTGAPVRTVEWIAVSGQANFNEPPMAPKPGKKLSAGVVAVEPDGRVWVVAPTNQFGGYGVTLPKGSIEKGMTTQSTAIREAFEESGLRVELTGFIGDVERSVRYPLLPG